MKTGILEGNVNDRPDYNLNNNAAAIIEINRRLRHLHQPPK